jgi:hypothetical protein
VPGGSTIEQKVRSAKPATAFDFCLLSSDAAQTTKVTVTAVCDADPFLKASSSPRQAAGGKLWERVLKCDLHVINAVEYGGRLDAGQRTRLQGVFTGGVCDWTKPGLGQQAAAKRMAGGGAWAARWRDGFYPARPSCPQRVLNTSEAPLKY